jgi:hypothetical protein
MLQKIKSFILSIRSRINSNIHFIRERIFAYKNKFLELKKNQKYFLTIMLIPHDQRDTKKIHISFKQFVLFLSILFICITFSSLVLLRHIGKLHELEDLKLSGEDYIKQEAKLKENLKEFHSVSSYYYDKIFRLYLKLGGDANTVFIKDTSIQPETYSSDSNDIFKETYQVYSDIHNLKKSIELTKEIIKTIKLRKAIIKNTPSLWPTKGYVLFPFGKYFSPIYGKEIENKGIDIGTFAGSEVIATAPGEVYDIGYSDYRGYYIKLNHNFGWKTIYSNLERLQVKIGDKVSKGQTLGYVTKTSSNIVYHLHYEVHVGMNPLNPYSFLNQIQN